MPWKETTVVKERREFVEWAERQELPFRTLCARFGVSVPTGRKWLVRYRAAGTEGLSSQSQRPLRQPGKLPAEVEDAVCALASRHPAWGARKLKRRLADLETPYVPAASTIQRVLERNGVERVRPAQTPARQRFEAPAPNALWQMDFKGYITLSRGGQCHPLTVLDDHSRFNLVLASCGNEQRGTVQEQLTRAFQRYGLPDRMLMDNGAPWGYTQQHRHTRLSAWLIRMDIAISHGRPYHPQTQGKEERFHRTLRLEVLDRRPAWTDLADVQHALDAWRTVYNFERPHDALAGATPATRYHPSVRPWPTQLPLVAYDHSDIVRVVGDHGEVSFRGQTYLVGRGFTGERVAIRPSADGVWDIYYCKQRVARIAPVLLAGV